MKKILIILILLLFSSSVYSAERILSFQSDIEISSDSSMRVTEEITVLAEGKEIKRGIYRDFPTDYRDRFGNRYRVGFEVLDVRRDGASEGYHTKKINNGIRVYLGRSDHYLNQGVYEYELTYRTDRQLGYFEKHDELYWNVTGHDWNFPIDSVEARVTLPQFFADDQTTAEAYTGRYGGKGNDYSIERGLSGEIVFSSTRPFASKEGMTIVVTWPKGYVVEPTARDEVVSVFRDNQAWVVAVCGLVIILVYYLAAWFRVGKDPAEGVVLAEYTPPPGFSPASSRFIERMGYDHKAFAAALINLAVQGLVEIIEENKDYVVKRTAAEATDLAAGEKTLLKNIFGSVNASAGKRQTLSQKYHAKIRRALNAHEESLRNDYEKKFFVTNKWWLVPGVVFTLLSLAATLLALDDGERIATGGFLLAWLSGWTVGVIVLSYRTINAWRGARTGGTVVAAIFMTLFSAPFVIAEVVVIGVMAHQVSPALPALLVGAIGLNLLFYQLLKAPTRAGRRLLDKIAGFRLFLDVAEKDEMNFKNPPEKTPELFEKYLPYALALDVEHRWAERFARLFADLQGSGDTYRPLWYHGRNWSAHHPTMLTGALGNSLSSALSSAATAPGSSSGSGGGGFSGGGGGGGGGGGW